MTGWVKQLNGGDPQDFPGAAFAAAGTIPKTQCTQALIHGDDGQILAYSNNLYAPGAFTGFDLTGKTLNISGTNSRDGDYIITSNTDDRVFTLPTAMGSEVGIHYYVRDGAALEEQQDIWSLFTALAALGYACTIKAGILYTNAPNAVMANQCLILWSPLS